MPPAAAGQARRSWTEPSSEAAGRRSRGRALRATALRWGDARPTSAARQEAVRGGRTRRRSGRQERNRCGSPENRHSSMEDAESDVQPVVYPASEAYCVRSFRRARAAGRGYVMDGTTPQRHDWVAHPGSSSERGKAVDPGQLPEAIPPPPGEPPVVMPIGHPVYPRQYRRMKERAKQGGVSRAKNAQEDPAIRPDGQG